MTKPDAGLNITATIMALPSAFTDTVGKVGEMNTNLPLKSMIKAGDKTRNKLGNKSRSKLRNKIAPQRL